MIKYTRREFERILLDNGFELVRQSGGHLIFKRNGEETCVIPQVIQEPIAKRLIKEHKLVLDRKEKKRCKYGKTSRLAHSKKVLKR